MARLNERIHYLPLHFDACEATASGVKVRVVVTVSMAADVTLQRLNSHVSKVTPVQRSLVPGHH
jgi:hypothetical protein